MFIVPPVLPAAWPGRVWTFTLYGVEPAFRVSILQASRFIICLRFAPLDVSFSELLAWGMGRVFSDQDKTDRSQTLLDLFLDVRPDIVITEAFPFGRRQNAV